MHEGAKFHQKTRQRNTVGTGWMWLLYRNSIYSSALMDMGVLTWNNGYFWKNSGCSTACVRHPLILHHYMLSFRLKCFENSKEQLRIISLPCLKVNSGNQKTLWLPVNAATYWNGTDIFNFFGTNCFPCGLITVGDYLNHTGLILIISFLYLLYWPQSTRYLICWLERRCLSSVHILPS